MAMQKIKVLSMKSNQPKQPKLTRKQVIRGRVAGVLGGYAGIQVAGIGSKPLAVSAIKNLAEGKKGLGAAKVIGSLALEGTGAVQGYKTARNAARKYYAPNKGR
jgi:hypothetical protein